MILKAQADRCTIGELVLAMKPVTTARSGPDRLAGSIVVVRGQRVLLDRDLAALYGVGTKRLNEQVRRNRRRFPPDFILR